jgi:AcrR family transcriptional regulator
MNADVSRRERKKQHTRSRLMDAALALFREHGYEETTIEQITERADVAKGTFFNYFETKESILPALAEHHLEQLSQSLLPEAGAPASPVERIKMAICRIAEETLSDATFTHRLFGARPCKHDQAHHGPPRGPAQAVASLLAEQVRQAQDAGEIRAELDPLQVGGILRGMLFNQMMLWHHGHRPAPLSELLGRAVDLLMEGVAGPAWKMPS